MKAAFFSPLPPAATGVADYSAALLKAMRRLGPVAIGARSTRANSTVALYHIGNNQLHRAIYRRALEHPGVIVMHDAVLQHFFLGSLDPGAYQDEFVYNYGEWMRAMAADLWKNRARSAADPPYFDFPMLKRITTQSRAVIVHNPAAARAVRRHSPDARVFEIPHLFSAPELPSLADALRFRAALRLKPRTPVIGVFGHLRESKRIAVLLRAMQRVWSGGSDARLLVAGAFASSDLERALTPLLGDPRIMRTGHLPERDFWRFAAITDVCVNLRYPTAGESSGIAVRMMGIGKPVIFTAGEEIARIPEDARLAIDTGPAEEEMLADSIRWLARDRETAQQIGARAAQHIAQEHALEKVAAQYWEVLKRS